MTAWLFAILLLAFLPPGAVATSVPTDTPEQASEEKPLWERFTILVWQYKTSMKRDLALYRRAGFRAFHIDGGATRKRQVRFAVEHAIPYYVDHLAGKGILHLTDSQGRQSILHKRRVVERPHSLADPATMASLKDRIRRNLAVVRRGPVLAYAFDDEISNGTFISPAEVDGGTESVARYRVWLRDQYQDIAALNAVWNTHFASFDEVQPVPFEALRRRHTRPPFARWNLAPWMDWRSYMDTQFAEVLEELTRFTNALDPTTPAGIVGCQQPAPYGGYDYAKFTQSIQWVECYDIGGSNEILRSLWSDGDRPRVLTWFSRGNAKADAWFLWYYLLHGNRGAIAWPVTKGASWFQHELNGLAPFIEANRQVIEEVQGDVSRSILDPGARFDTDPIAVLLSHPSVQAGWAADVVTHGATWPNRLSSIDNANQTAARNRVAWLKLLEDCGFQYDVVTGAQLAGGEVWTKGYRVLVLPRAMALSDEQAAAVRRFAASGGTVIADYLTGLLDHHGKGRPAGGALDALFGLQRDESKGYLNGRTITEVDGERYRRPFMERLHAYDGALRYRGLPVYERGTRAQGAHAGARAGGADVLIERRTPRGGRTVYLNLTPVAYSDEQQRLGTVGGVWRDLLSKVLFESGLRPRAQVISGGRPVPLAELLYWRRGERLVVGLVKNPNRGSVRGAVRGGPVEVEIRFRGRIRQVKNLRTGEDLPDGNVIRTRWKPWEGLLFELRHEAP